MDYIKVLFFLGNNISAILVICPPGASPDLLIPVLCLGPEKFKVFISFKSLNSIGIIYRRVLSILICWPNNCLLRPSSQSYVNVLESSQSSNALLDTLKSYILATPDVFTVSIPILDFMLIPVLLGNDTKWIFVIGSPSNLSDILCNIDLILSLQTSRSYWVSKNIWIIIIEFFKTFFKLIYIIF